MEPRIETEETLSLARELAALTGESAADAVAAAVRERLERERGIAAKVKELEAIAKRCARLMGPGPHPDHGDLLYDERGLPK